MKTQIYSPAAPAYIGCALADLLVPRIGLWSVMAILAALEFVAPPARAAVAEAWVRRYSNVVNNADDQPIKVVRDPSGDIIVTGTTVGGDTPLDMQTIKYSGANGTVIWERRYNNPANGDDQALTMAVDESGHVFVTAYSHDGNDSNALGENSFSVYYTAKYAAADGALLWELRQNGPRFHDHYARVMTVDGSGNVVVTGTSQQGDPLDGFYYDYYTAKYAAADGALLWEQRYDGGPGHSVDEAHAVAVDFGGNVVVTGYSSGANFDYGYYTAKYATADGTLLWEKRYNGPGSERDEGRAVALDGSGNVVVTGTSFDSTGNSDYYTAKYAAADGALLWEKRYNGPAGADDQAKAVVVDAGGNVVVTGYSSNDEWNFDKDYYTAKYAAADGALLWEKRYNGPANTGDDAYAMALDGSGNVVVTGASDVSGGGLNTWNADYYTVKYAAADGALLWEKRCHGPANGNDIANAVAVDGSGNVLVTGGSSDGTHSDFYTAKYAAADGVLLWEKRYNGPANDNDQADAVAVDASGNVVVTGYSSNGINFDHYTAKYAASDGTLLWEKYYQGPPIIGWNYDASSLALGPNDIVAITGSSGADCATVVYRDIPPPVSFAAWAACSGLTGAAAAADADPDSDGLPNSAEYILGGSPKVPGTSGRPAVTTSGSNMVFTFPRDDASETPDVTLTVETGTDLLAWPAVFHIGPNTAASSPGVSITENGAALDTITVTIPQGTAPRHFARLKVSIGP